MSNIMKKFFVFVLRRKLGLKKEKPGDTIKWYESETVLSGIAVGLYGVYQIVGVVANNNFGVQIPEIPGGALALISSVLGGTIVWGRLTAEKKIQ